MASTFWWVLVFSVAFMAGELIYRIVTGSARRLPRVVVLALAGFVVYALAPAPVEKMGSLDETASIVFCYAAMLLGMMAEYFYTQAEKGATKLKFEALPFVMPILASPIVFIPLLTLTSELGGGGAFTRARVMVYLVAFQNGFFWRTFFEQRKKQASASLTSGRPVAAV
jgi:hypothetical protein